MTLIEGFAPVPQRRRVWIWYTIIAPWLGISGDGSCIVISKQEPSISFALWHIEVRSFLVAMSFQYAWQFVTRRSVWGKDMGFEMSETKSFKSFTQ